MAILEVFKNTNRTRQYLECEDSSGENLLEAVKNGAVEGMQHFDAELERLVRADAVDVQTGFSYASDAQQLQSALSGVSTEVAFSRLSQADFFGFRPSLFTWFPIVS